MTGLTFLPAEKGMQVLRQSATGDVFSQDLSMSRKATKQLSEIELMTYSRWSKPTLELPRESELCASVTCTYDFQPLVKGTKISHSNEFRFEKEHFLLNHIHRSNACMFSKTKSAQTIILSHLHKKLDESAF